MATRTTCGTCRARKRATLCPGCASMVNDFQGEPNPVEREWRQEADAEHEAHQDALRKRLREGL